MTSRQKLALLFGLLTAVACVRLGFWQLARLRQRRIHNDIVVARMVAPPVSPFELIAGTRQYRRVTWSGTFDFDHQIVLAGRSHDGSPGVYLITPFNPDIPAPPLLVNRGWVYSADAQHVDFAKFDETPHQTLNGYVEEFDLGGEGPSRMASTTYAWRRLDARDIRDAFPFRIGPFYIVALADSGARPASHDSPIRLNLPVLDNGPHLSYAIQWFSFAAIALVGAGIVIWKDRNVTVSASA